ncbi:Protein kinase C-binding protein nell1 [Goodea atripinnis]|uniref:Protein kinase C-binding protein nell1 n=1 Tax=Goodea atripinnis TaxID=208336 RepID=A0ABV0MZ05_9TELE
MRTCSAVLAVTTDPLVSVWTRVDERCTAEGEVDCWPLVCPVLLCEYTAVAEGECCPRCVTDPCLADNLSYDIRQACTDPTGVTRLSGDTWHMPQSPCTTCKCKVGQCIYNDQTALFQIQ